MAFSEQTRSGDQAETFKSEGKALAEGLRVAMPGIIRRSCYCRSAAGYPLCRNR